MKSWITRSLLCALACCHLVSAYADDQQVISLAQLTEENAAEFFANEETPIVLEFTEGMKVPVSFFLKGGLLQLEGSADLVIHIQRTFYMKHTENGFAFSLDGTKWETVGAFITGCLSAELNVADGNPCFTLGAEINAVEADDVTN